MRTFNLFLFFCLFGTASFSQEKEKPEMIIHLGYYASNNAVQYLRVQTQLKADSKIQPLKDVEVQIYLDSIDVNKRINTIKTDEKGIAETSIPVSLKDQWAIQPDHKFIAVTTAAKDQESTTTELPIAKAKILLDTLNEDGARSVTAQVMAYSNGTWTPTKGVEVKIGVRRLGGNLKIGDDETYTTDSLGQVKGEFKLDTLPADDKKGDITLVARIEDNDQFGNISLEKTVPWGKYYVRESKWGQRSLWATRFRSPVWLLFMAYSIIGAVWGVVIFLGFQIWKIKKLGRSAEKSELEMKNREKLSVQPVL